MLSNDTAGEGHSDSPSIQDMSGHRHAPSSSEVHHIYDDVRSIGFSRQVNADMLSENSVGRGPKNHYMKLTAEDHSFQFNGNVGSVEYLKALLAPRCEQIIAGTGYVYTHTHPM